MKPVVFDLDDLCDQYDPYDLLMKWKDTHQAGKMTLFAIPRRCSDKLVRKYLDMDWVQLAMHGWWHTLGECLYWTEEDAREKFNMASNRGFIHGFKAPKWVITGEVYRAAKESGWWVADHVRNESIYWRSGVPVYIYNQNKDVVSAHGHTWNTSGNGLEQAWKSFQFPAEATFKWVSEVVNERT